MNPTVRNHVLDVPNMERNRTPLRKPINIATVGKQLIAEQEMARNDIKVLGVTEMW